MTATEAILSNPAARRPMASPTLPSAMSEEITVETRFGQLTCTSQAIVDMPQGPLGFSQHRRFAVLDLPNPRLAQFKLLQSMTDPAVSFVVVPASRDSGLIAPQDIDEACEAAGIPPANVLVLLIVTVRQRPDGTAMTVNLRAPVVLDVQRRVARQTVLTNANYSVQHPL